MASPWTEIACYRCKEQFWVSNETYQVLKRSGVNFWCPFGHQQHFVPGKTEAEKLRDQLDEERRRRQSAEQSVAMHVEFQKQAEASARGYKGVATRLKNRAKAGICPCCKRHFSQLESHMAAKHPDFSTNPDGDLPADVPPVLSVVEGGKL